MSWLHSFWGLGAMTGPILLSILLTIGSNWRRAYLMISGIQFVLTAIVFLSLPLWGRMAERVPNEPGSEANGGANGSPIGSDGRPVYRRKGFFGALFSMFLYCSVEQSYML